MKNYFDFHLQAKKLVLFYLMIFIFIVMPYAWIVYSFIQKFNQEPEGLIIMIPVIVFMLLAMLALNFYFFKLFLENISYQDEKLNFKGDFSAYLGQILLGLLLSIITLGIYYPWFMKRIYRFFATNTEYKEERFDFMSKGFKLFLIMLLTLIIPMFIFTLYVKMEGIDISTKSPLNYYISQIIKSIILIPYLYYYYKWIINFKYRDFQIKMKAKFWPAAGKITIEMLLAVLTLGIYFLWLI